MLQNLMHNLRESDSFQWCFVGVMDLINLINRPQEDRSSGDPPISRSSSRDTHEWDIKGISIKDALKLDEFRSQVPKLRLQHHLILLLNQRLLHVGRKSSCHTMTSSTPRTLNSSGLSTPRAALDGASLEKKRSKLNGMFKTQEEELTRMFQTSTEFKTTKWNNSRDEQLLLLVPGPDTMNTLLTNESPSSPLLGSPLLSDQCVPLDLMTDSTINMKPSEEKNIMAAQLGIESGVGPSVGTGIGSGVITSFTKSPLPSSRKATTTRSVLPTSQVLYSLAPDSFILSTDCLYFASRLFRLLAVYWLVNSRRSLTKSEMRFPVWLTHVKSSPQRSIK